MPLFEMSADALVPVPSTTFATEQVLERADLQRLLRARIDMISEGVLVVAEEFGAFAGAHRPTRRGLRPQVPPRPAFARPSLQRAANILRTNPAAATVTRSRQTGLADTKRLDEGAAQELKSARIRKVVVLACASS